jgi:hypothetical protein
MDQLDANGGIIRGWWTASRDYSWLVLTPRLMRRLGERLRLGYLGWTSVLRLPFSFGGTIIESAGQPDGYRH